MLTSDIIVSLLLLDRGVLWIRIRKRINLLLYYC